MKTIKIDITWLCQTTFLFGFSDEYIQKEPLSIKSAEIKVQIDQSEWDKAKNGVNQIQRLYKKNKWKYQLLGQDSEYNTLDEHIQRLMMSVEEKDGKEAKINL